MVKMRDYKQFFALLNEAGQTENRKAIVLGFTDGRTDSLKELSDMEYIELTRKLIGVVHSTKPALSKRIQAAKVGVNAEKALKDGEKADKMRKKLIWVLCSMGGMKVGGEVLDFARTDNGGKANMQNVNLAVLRLGYLKKPLNSYTLAELPKLVAQFQTVKKNNWNAEANRAVKELVTG